MAAMRYLSLFSGVGGLEAAHDAPLLCCELDAACHPVLRRRFPKAELHDDVRDLTPPSAEVVAGGWPCQDLSVAGLRKGLEGERSGLFFELLRVARDAQVHTVIAENVPNLLLMQSGTVFRLVLEAFAREGFNHVGWRVLDARAFALPHHRRRVFLVASRHLAIARALHRPLPEQGPLPARQGCAGFYWTAGLQSICYSQGYVPALKVGSALSIPSPPALHFGDCVRKATPDECLRLQGFKTSDFEGVRAADQYRMAGNAVAAPVGRFAMGALEAGPAPAIDAAREGPAGPCGLFTDGRILRVEHPVTPLAQNLDAFVDLEDRGPLSIRAAAGLLSRLGRSGKPCPDALKLILSEIVAPVRA
jgi:DNA (cytosine-5)-methyltransferase 1